ncbi:MAG: hypothetical protein AABY22_02350 [Nanoarchaeota archaeon]
MKTEVLFLLAMVAIFTIGSHLHDVGSLLKEEGKTATNGFYNVDASRLYHSGWYMMYLGFFALLIAYIGHLDRKVYK